SVCPVLYLPEHGETTVIFEQIAENIQKNVSAIKRIKEIVPLEYKSTLIDVSNLYDNLVDLIMFVKPYIGSYERKFNGFKDNNYKFYDEREWRYKPNKMLCRSFLTKQEYESFENPEERNSNLSVITF